MESTIRAIVTDVERVSPGFVRVALATALGEWTTSGDPDEFVHVELGAEEADVAHGHTARHYTISRVRPDGIEMEIATHGHGPGAAWGESVLPGDEVLISEPKGYYRAPDAHVTRLLIGDATAIPAIARILEEARPDERFRVVIEVATMADSRTLTSLADVDLEWRIGGNGIGPSVLMDAVQRLLDSTESQPYLWVACESALSRRIRTYARGERGLPTSALRIVGYWHAEHDRIMSVWNGLTDDQRDRYMAVWRDDRSDEENWIEAEPLLRAFGF
jgi:NADPH-dependent ferric siderophore reductase